MHTPRTILLAICLSLATVGWLIADDVIADDVTVDDLAADEAAADAPQEAEIRAWIANLDSDRFLVRERATTKLSQVGIPAIEILATAADGDKLEVATRAIRVLLKYCEHGDKDLAFAALERVAALQNRPAESAAAESLLIEIRASRALAAIRKLGGEIVTGNVVNVRGQHIYLKLSDAWKGGDDGIKHVKDLHWLVRLSIYTNTVTDAGIDTLHGLPLLQRIDLYGAAVTTEGVAELRKRLPHVAVEVRRSRALLGISCSQFAQRAVISTVQPKSAASAAGLRQGDIITAFNDKPVGDFKRLTAMIAVCQPGEKVRLQILREGHSIVKEATLGPWR